MFFVLFLFVCFSPIFLIFIFVSYLLFFIITLVFLLNSYYYSYIIYLLFMSGLLVMFMYVCSIITNEKIYLNLSFFIFFSFFLIFFVIFFVEEFIYFVSGGLLFYCDFYNLFKFFIFSFNIFSLFFIIYLFFCLIVVYEIIKKSEGPLRMSII